MIFATQNFNSATQNDAYMLYNKNMNKIFLLIMLTFISVNIVFASEIVKQITYSNGTTVLICNTNGIIDYCSERDRQNSIVALNNPNIYVTEEINVNTQISNNSFNQKNCKAYETVQTGAELVNSLTGAVRAVKSLIGEIK